MTDPVDLRYAVDGPADAPVVILAHAIGMTMDMWDPQLAALATGWRVVRIDQRGHGGSPVPAGPYELADLGTDLIRVLDRLAIEDATICGLSLGGMVGLWVAAHAPERVDRLIAACAVARPVSPGAWLDRAQAVRSGGTIAVADLVVERWGYTDRDPALETYIRTRLAATPAEGYAGCCEALAGMDLTEDLGRVVAPTLLLAGSDDPAAPPPVVAEMAGAMADARVQVVDGAAHLLNVEQPGVVTEAILKHLRR